MFDAGCRTVWSGDAAPRAAAFYAFADRELGAGVGPLVPATDVHR